jgi:capsular exopolysaccharide synthesis family protein
VSRIHEALEKARQQQPGSAPELPNVQDIIAAGVTLPDPAQPTRLALDSSPLDRLEPVADSGSILAHIRQRDWPTSGSDLIFLGGEIYASAQEQFRTLRSRLYQLQGDGALKVIVITSAIPGEGKSFVSANLAHAFALQSNRRVLVIDADIRRADGLSTLLGAPCAPGLTDYLLGEQRLEDVIQAGSQKNFYLISCGKRVSKPGELIGDSRFRILIDKLRPVFDWIIIDTPPIVPIADARMIADFADGVLMVVNARSTLAHLAKRAVQEFPRESLIGILLNRTSEPSATYYSEYGYGYGSGEFAAAQSK